MSDPKPQFILSIEDKHTPLWRKLMKHWEERLATLRAENDRDMDETRTARHRGMLAEIKANLSLDRDMTEFELPPR